MAAILTLLFCSQSVDHDARQISAHLVIQWGAYNVMSYTWGMPHRNSRGKIDDTSPKIEKLICQNYWSVYVKAAYILHTVWRGEGELHERNMIDGFLMGKEMFYRDVVFISNEIYGLTLYSNLYSKKYYYSSHDILAQYLSNVLFWLTHVFWYPFDPPIHSFAFIYFT